MSCESLSHSKWECKYHVMFMRDLGQVLFFYIFENKMGTLIAIPAAALNPQEGSEKRK